MTKVIIEIPFEILFVYNFEIEDELKLMILEVSHRRIDFKGNKDFAELMEKMVKMALKKDYSVILEFIDDRNQGKLLKRKAWNIRCLENTI